MQNAMFVSLAIWEMLISKLECLEVKGNKLVLNCLHARKVVGGNSQLRWHNSVCMSCILMTVWKFQFSQSYESKSGTIQRRIHSDCF